MSLRRIAAWTVAWAVVLAPTVFLQMQNLHAQISDGENVVVSLNIANSAVPINVIAIPEKRIPSTGNNSTHLTIEVRQPGETSYVFSGTVITTANGTYSGVQLTNVSDGATYDITAKGFSHLRRKESNVTITSGSTIDFTANGTNPLLSGDVNGASGDNKVNGIDLTLIVGGLNGSNERLDLNQDTKVNGIDLTNAVDNLNKTGDI
ncbi:MAG TPA: hypothetical protein VHA78_01615 [Candidatus Peribacteraceae bacterium]|nr:hypothetical protein [Candidatus Peribacteraceae bacterium]